MTPDTVHITGYLKVAVRDEIRQLAEANNRSFNFILNELVGKGLEITRAENEKKENKKCN